MSQKRVGMEVSIAMAEAVKLANVDCISAYPITPQTHIVEHLSELVANGELDAEFIPVESEHSALSVCAGTSAVGARTFTATSSQGFALMHEILFIVAGMRLPIVMALANRALSAPLSIWNDHSDAMASRDCGWVQIFTENGQEVFDQTICAFKIAEDPRVLIPTIINFDGFTLSHVVEPHILVSQEDVDKFLPVYKPLFTLHPDKPLTMGAFGMPEIYSEAKKAQDINLTQFLRGNCGNLEGMGKVDRAELFSLGDLPDGRSENCHPGHGQFLRKRHGSRRPYAGTGDPGGIAQTPPLAAIPI